MLFANILIQVVELAIGMEFPFTLSDFTNIQLPAAIPTDDEKGTDCVL